MSEKEITFTVEELEDILYEVSESYYNYSECSPHERIEWRYELKPDGRIFKKKFGIFYHDRGEECLKVEIIGKGEIKERERDD